MKAGLVSILGFLLLAPLSAMAQTPYSISFRSQGFQPLPLHGGTATTHVPSGSADEGTATINLPFTVRFFDVDKSTIMLSTNGFATWGSSNAWTNQNLPSTSTPNDVMAPWWDDNSCSQFKTQIFGAPGSQTFVAEWRCSRLGSGSSFDTQLWLFEGSSTIEFHYGKRVSGTGWTATMGIENATGTIGYKIPSAATGNTCNDNCGPNDWHEDTIVTFSQGPELRMVEVLGQEEAFAGVPMKVQATVTNVGGEPAENFTVRFSISPTKSLGPEARELVTLDGDVRSLPQQGVATFEANPRLPPDLEEGTYYLVAEADPHRAVSETNRSDNVGYYGPFGIGIRAPNFKVSHVEVNPDRVGPGMPAEVSFEVENIGNLDGFLVDYDIVLSTSRFVGPSSIVLGRGRIDSIEMLGRVETSHVVTLPTDLQPGIYHVGVAMDPDRAIFEHDRSDNALTSEGILVAEKGLLIQTNELPPAQAGGHYSVRLSAYGGDGSHLWSVAEGSTLPPGLSLVRQEGKLGVATFLRGVPEVPEDVGSEFTLVVSSAGLTDESTFRLAVIPGKGRLSIPSDSLAFASFGFDYEEWLSVIGGRPPFDWSVAKGDLPFGVLLRSDGLLTGMPMQDGTFEVTVQVVDSTGMRATRVLLLDVAPPSSLTCVTRVIPDMALGAEKVRVDLIAAGGTKRAGLVPYLWSQGKTMRLVTGIGQEEAQIDGLPAGLELRDARISGSPKEIGDYVWTTELTDAAGGKVSCPIRLRVAPDRGLTITTQALPTGFAGRSYLAQLDAAGGTSPYVWSELGDGRVLEELGLSFNSETGELRGTPRMERLEGEDSKVFTFMLRVRDSANRVGIAPMTIRVDAKPPKAEGPAKAEESRCQAAAGAPALWALAAIAAAALRRRRR